MPTRPFYEGKVAAARFFAATVLPRLAAEREIAEATTLDVMDLRRGRVLARPRRRQISNWTEARSARMGVMHSSMTARCAGWPR